MHPANSSDGKRILLRMKIKKQSLALLLGAVLAGGSAFGWSQDGAKQDMKDAGHETKNAARDVGHGTKKGTEKAYHSTKRGTKKAWHKTKNTTRGAVDGAKEGAHEHPQE